MKKIILSLLSAVYIIPTHTMLMQLGRAAKNVGLHITSQQMPLSAESIHMQHNTAMPSLITHVPATRLARIYSTIPSDFYNPNEHTAGESRTDDASEENQQDDKHRSTFFKFGTGLSLGLTLFGSHLGDFAYDYPDYTEGLEEVKNIEYIVKHFQHFPSKKQRKVCMLLTDKFRDPAQNQSTLDALSRFAIQQIHSLLLTSTGAYFLETAIKKSPAAAAGIAQQFVKDFARLTDSNEGEQTIKQLLKCYPEYLKTFTPLMLEHSSSLITNAAGQRLIRYFIKKDPSSAPAFTQCALNNFNALIEQPIWIKTAPGILLIQVIADHNPEARELFAELILANFSTIMKAVYWNDLAECFIERIIMEHTKLMQNEQHFSALAQHKNGRIYLRETVESDTLAAGSFTKQAITHFSDLIIDFAGRVFMERVITANPKSIDCFTEQTFDNFSTLIATSEGIRLLKTIITFNQQVTHEERFKALAGQHSCQELQEFIDQQSFRRILTGMFSNSITQTTQHFKALQKDNLEKLVKFFPSEKNNIQTFFHMIDTIIKTEEEEQAKGNYTFVHAYPWKIRFLQDLDAHLRAIIDEAPKKPLSLRFHKGPRLTDADNSYSTIRTELLTKGSSGYYTYDDNKQKHMIFMNYALLTNQHGSNTLQYIANDRCENPPALLLENIFKHLDIEQYFGKYKAELEELERLHDNTSTFGAGILFSFTPQMLKESVYVCRGGGRKRTVFIQGIGETDDVALIVDTLRSTPEKITDLDHVEFVFVVTKDCALNPRVIEAEAYKTIPFNASNAEALAQYEQKRDIFIANITADIAAERAALSETEKNLYETHTQQTQEWFTACNCLSNDTQTRAEKIT